MINSNSNRLSTTYCSSNRLVFLFFVLCTFSTCANTVHQWAVEVKGGKDVAEKLARDLGLSFRGQIGSLKFFLFEGHPSEPFSNSSYSRFSKREILVNWLADVTSRLSKHSQVSFFEKQIPKKRVKRSLLTTFNDPMLPKSWYLLGDGSLGMNVQPVWERGFTGKNVVVSILDDGIEKDHPDLAKNYDSAASFDINDNDNDPTPRYDKAMSNQHGTRCAGEVAAVANNSICSLGVAFNSKIGGVRMLDGSITDAVEAAALSLNPQHIDIYSASWGPDDDGHSLEMPGLLAQKAFIEGVTMGRGGRGNIFVWASGNGGAYEDSCACDGYASSIYTVSVSSTTEKGMRPYYLEECASTLATTYSSGNSIADHQVVTTDIHHGCTEYHTGTSASAALAAGMIALMIEANANLTWRDVQHIIVETSRTEPLLDAQWHINGVGRKVSNRYGFGLMDGLAMIQLAQVWQMVPEQTICESKENWGVHIIKGHENLALTVNMDTCNGGEENTIHHLEHVQVRLSMELFQSRGDIAIFLTSPSGTSSHLLPARPSDRQPGRFDRWPLMSVHFWGETDAKGRWRLELLNIGNETNRGVLTDWQLILYGTRTAPLSTMHNSRLPYYEITSNVSLVTFLYDSTATPNVTDINQDENIYVVCISVAFALSGLIILVAAAFCQKRNVRNNNVPMTQQASPGEIATLSNNLPMIELHPKPSSSTAC